ncbi:MAG: nuclear transport factor 2 family protein [Phycisphaerae bacterium]|nr:nuclear transport factor 2 family protein [Phycisphaerae bacterium]
MQKTIRHDLRMLFDSPPSQPAPASDEAVVGFRRAVLKEVLTGSITAIGTALTILVLAACGPAPSSERSTAPPGGPVAVGSDQDQITTVIAKFETAWNDSDFDAFMDITCEETRPNTFRPGNSDIPMTEEDFEKARTQEGRVELTVKAIFLDGDTAIAAVDEKSDAGLDNDEIKFVREGGAWKGCACLAAGGRFQCA